MWARDDTPLRSAALVAAGKEDRMEKRHFGSSRICGKARPYGNQTILVWRGSAPTGLHIRGFGPELEALATFSAPPQILDEPDIFLRAAAESGADLGDPAAFGKASIPSVFNLWSGFFQRGEKTAMTSSTPVAAYRSDCRYPEADDGNIDGLRSPGTVYRLF